MAPRLPWRRREPPAREPHPNLVRLRERIEQLGGQEAYPVVALELFFEGNDDPASIGPNLDPPPSVQTFYRVLKEIRARPEVADVVLQISEAYPGGADEWPFVDAAYVITTADPAAVHEWARDLSPDEYEPGDEQRWVYGADAPPGAPPIPPGHHLVTLFWD